MDNMENKLQKALFSLAPDCFDEIMARTPVRVESEEELLGTPQESGRRNKFRRSVILSFASAVAVLFLGIFSWNVYNQFHTVDRIYIDVNPSVCLSLNKAGKVTKAEGINPEGEEIVSQVKEKLKGSSEPDAMFDVLLDELNSEGYFPDQQMDMLLSYCYSSEGRAELIDELAESAQTYADENNLEAVLLVQTFSMDDPAVSEGLAKGISPGKCYLISEIEEKYGVNLDDFELQSLKDLQEYAQANNLNLSDLFQESGMEDYANSDSSGQEEDENSTEGNPGESDTKQTADTKDATADSEVDKAEDKTVEKETDSETAKEESKQESTRDSGTSEKKAEQKKKTVSKEKKSEKKKSNKSKKSDKKHNTTEKKKEETSVASDKPNPSDTPSATKPPVTPVAPGTSDKPDTPDTPDQPDTPDTPDNPDTPDTPDTPDNPDTPDTPDTPDNPDQPDNPDNPGNPYWPWYNWQNRSGN